MSLCGVSSKYLWQFVEQQQNAKSLKQQTLEFSADEVQGFVMSQDLDQAAKTLAARIQHLPFPTVSANSTSTLKMTVRRNLLDAGSKPDKYLYETLPEKNYMVASCPEDNGRSHMIVRGKRWAANHGYGVHWKPLILGACAVAINNPSGSNHPGRFIDFCTDERFHSSTVRTGYKSPVEGWATSLPQICKKMLTTVRFGADKAQEQGLPFTWEKITDSDFREAAIDLFPCSYHFPPTALHAVVHVLEALSPELFKDGCRMLDPSAGHGHRLAAAVSCPKITYMAATDPNSRMQVGYKKIAEELSGIMGRNTDKLYFNFQSTIGGISSGSPRIFKVLEGKAEDPTNPIYKVDKLYNLVFSSPPFFNTEAYGDGKDQSITSFDTFETWVDGFLEPMLTNCWNVLEKGGYVVLNLTDAHTNKCVDALIRIMTEKLKGEYLGVIASRKAVGVSRWTRAEDRKITIDQGIDPIWVFKKT